MCCGNTALQPILLVWRCNRNISGMLVTAGLVILLFTSSGTSSACSSSVAARFPPDDPGEVFDPYNEELCVKFKTHKVYNIIQELMVEKALFDRELLPRRTFNLCVDVKLNRRFQSKTEYRYLTFFLNHSQQIKKLRVIRNGAVFLFRRLSEAADSVLTKVVFQCYLNGSDNLRHGNLLLWATSLDGKHYTGRVSLYSLLVESGQSSQTPSTLSQNSMDSVEEQLMVLDGYCDRIKAHFPDPGDGYIELDKYNAVIGYIVKLVNWRSMHETEFDQCLGSHNAGERTGSPLSAQSHPAVGRPNWTEDGSALAFPALLPRVLYNLQVIIPKTSLSNEGYALLNFSCCSGTPDISIDATTTAASQTWWILLLSIFGGVAVCVCATLAGVLLWRWTTLSRSSVKDIDGSLVNKLKITPNEKENISISSDGSRHKGSAHLSKPLLGIPLSGDTFISTDSVNSSSVSINLTHPHQLFGFISPDISCFDLNHDCFSPCNDEETLQLHKRLLRINGMDDDVDHYT